MCSLSVCVLRFTPWPPEVTPRAACTRTLRYGGGLYVAPSAWGLRPAQAAFMAASNCKAAVGLLKRSLSLTPAQKPGGNQRSLLGINWLQERELRESRAALKCIPLPAVSAARFHPVTFLCQDSMRDSLKVCYKYLNETSRSFASVIQALDGELRHAVCIFYLVLRALDTVEDDMTISLQAKIPMLYDFHTYLYEPDWRFMESKEKDKQVLEDFPTISLEFRNLEKEYQVVISDICHKMGVGMAEFLERKVESLQEWDKYCHYVAGLVGIGLSRLFSASELEDPVVGHDTQLSNSMGLFLQKTNIIRDYLEDEMEGREFWPREVWSKYAKKLSDLAKPENIDLAVHCMNDLITNALQHVPDVLTYLSRLKNQSVFNFCAIPQVMAIATLAACYNNHQVFRGVVKIRKGQAITLMMDATNLQAVKAMMYQYVEEIYQKIPSTDPSCKKTQQIIISIRTQSLPSGALVSRNHFSPVYLSCAMLLAALSWQYLTSVSHASDEFVQVTEN